MKFGVLSKMPRCQCIAVMQTMFHVCLSFVNALMLWQKLHPSSWAVVEFYASWCPHCIHFAPTYDQVAQFLLKQRASGHPVFVGRIDCAEQVSREVRPLHHGGYSHPPSFYRTAHCGSLLHTPVTVAVRKHIKYTSSKKLYLFHTS